MSRESSHGIDYERMSGDARSFDADVPEADFEDPFAKVGSGPSYDNLPMTREDYGYGEAAQSRDSAATELSSGSSGSASVQSRSTSSADLYMSLNAGALGSGFGAQRQEKQYLAHERRSLWGQCSYNIGARRGAGRRHPPFSARSRSHRRARSPLHRAPPQATLISAGSH